MKILRKVLPVLLVSNVLAVVMLVYGYYLKPKYEGKLRLKTFKKKPPFISMNLFPHIYIKYKFQDMVVLVMSMHKIDCGKWNRGQMSQ
jgi:penicillin amidase